MRLSVPHIIIAIVILASAAQAQQACVISGYINKNDLTPASGHILRVNATVPLDAVSGLYSGGTTADTSDASGYIEMTVTRNSIIYVSCDPRRPVRGFPSTPPGIALVVPDAPTHQLASLLPPETVPPQHIVAIPLISNYGDSLRIADSLARLARNESASSPARDSVVFVFGDTLRVPQYITPYAGNSKQWYHARYVGNYPAGVAQAPFRWLWNTIEGQDRGIFFEDYTQVAIASNQALDLVSYGGNTRVWAKNLSDVSLNTSTHSLVLTGAGRLTHNGQDLRDLIAGKGDGDSIRTADSLARVALDSASAARQDLLVSIAQLQAQLDTAGAATRAVIEADIAALYGQVATLSGQIADLSARVDTVGAAARAALEADVATLDAENTAQDLLIADAGKWVQYDAVGTYKVAAPKWTDAAGDTLVAKIDNAGNAGFAGNTTSGTANPGDSTHTVGSATEKGGLHVHGGGKFEGEVTTKKLNLPATGYTGTIYQSSFNMVFGGGLLYAFDNEVTIPKNNGFYAVTTPGRTGSYLYDNGMVIAPRLEINSAWGASPSYGGYMFAVPGNVWQHKDSTADLGTVKARAFILDTVPTISRTDTAIVRYLGGEEQRWYDGIGYVGVQEFEVGMYGRNFWATSTHLYIVSDTTAGARFLDVQYESGAFPGPLNALQGDFRGTISEQLKGARSFAQSTYTIVNARGLVPSAPDYEGSWPSPVGKIRIALTPAHHIDGPALIKLKVRYQSTARVTSATPITIQTP